MGSEGGVVFCRSSFWDLNLTWHTEEPELTSCFQDTVLTWLPCAFLWLTSPVDFYLNLKGTKRILPWTILHITKIILTICLLLNQILYLVYNSKEKTSDDLEVAPFLGNAVMISTFILVLYTESRNRCQGRRSSAILFMFWLFLSVCSCLTFASTLVQLFSQTKTYTSGSIYFIVTSLHFLLSVVQLVFSSLNESTPFGQDEGKLQSPLLSASFLSRITFQWMHKFMVHGYRKLLTVADLYRIIPELCAQKCYKAFEVKWLFELSKRKGQSSTYQEDSEKEQSTPDVIIKSSARREPSLVKAVIKSFWPSLLATAVVEVVFDILRLLPILLLNPLIQFSGSNEPEWRGYIYALAFLLASLMASLCIIYLVYISLKVALKIKASLIAAIYRKSLVISSSSQQQFTVGELVNLMAVDADKVYSLASYGTVLFGAPIRVILTLVLLWRYLGPSCLAGVVVIIAVMPFTGILAKKGRTAQEKQMKTKDVRLKQMSEILNGIKILKLYAWEPPFLKRVMDIRNTETGYLRRFLYMQAGMSFLWNCTPFMVSVVSFATYILVDERNVLDPVTAFVSLSLFSAMRFSLTVLPELIANLIQTRVALNRIHKFLTSDELDPDARGQNPNPGEAITVKTASFSWGGSKVPLLKDISLNVKKGGLVAIVGQVGCGKSSLISALLGDMYKLSGEIDLKGTIAYVPQQAWIQNATVRRNIIFTKSYSKELYQTVIDKCCLKPDLEILPASDLTEIGEKGVNLSGGQKQRVSLARAVYQDADIYFFDDPLSAVDAHVSASLFSDIIGPKGMLKNKTRLLVTHSLSVLQDADCIVVLKNGKIEEMGTYENLVASRGNLSLLLSQYTKQENTNKVEDLPSFGRSVSQFSEMSKTSSFSVESVSQQNSFLERATSIETMKIGGQLTETERMEVGRVQWSVYLHYFKNIGWIVTAMINLGYAGYRGFDMGANVWLSEWSNDEALPDGSLDIRWRNIRLIGFAAFGLAQGACILFGATVLAYGALKASRILHNQMLNGIVRTPMYFFDTTPLGRILNRFGKDVDNLDLQLPGNVDIYLECLFQVVGTVILTSIQLPLFLVAVVPLFAIYIFMQNVYVTTSRQVKRLESVARSPVYSHFGETVAGSSSIRAFKAQQHFIDESDSRLNMSQNCTFHYIGTHRWLSFRLELLGGIINFITTLLIIVKRGTIDAGTAGLILSYAFGFTESFNWLVRISADLENTVVSAERLEEYAQLKPEAPWTVEDKKPPEMWPEQGQVHFDGYSTRYREGLDLVLRNITLNIRPCEKVGVVGRTGAGKSSLTLSLFRIVEPASGKIIIDGVDVSSIGLHDLRSKLTIIPQDPVLFNGTLRQNLDPNEEYSDENIWKALERAHLKGFATSHDEGLQYEVAEGGQNLSVGQRQLVCLARALLRKTKILILDEATAAVDVETDKLIQDTIRADFSDCTTITIAHRLHTIIDADRIIVMASGEIAEEGPPSELLQSETLFHSMAKEAGII